MAITAAVGVVEAVITPPVIGAAVLRSVEASEGVGKHQQQQYIAVISMVFDSINNRNNMKLLTAAAVPSSLQSATPVLGVNHQQHNTVKTTRVIYSGKCIKILQVLGKYLLGIKKKVKHSSLIKVLILPFIRRKRSIIHIKTHTCYSIL